MKRPAKRLLTAWFVGAVLLACVGPATASEPPLAAPRGKAAWRPEWDRFTPAEGAATIGLTLGSYFLEKRVPDPDHALLGGPVPLLDAPVRYVFRGRTRQEQVTFERLSDIGFRGLALFPYVVDAGVVALGVHRDPDLAAQLALIDAEALTLSGITQIAASKLIGRARPYEEDCRGPGSQTTSRTCGKPDDKSFYSGHAAAAFTSAGLVCLHHQNIPLYGGGAPDAWACTWALTVATGTGLLRIAADDHWASDVLVGVGIGWFYGYVMPRFLHYDTRRARAKRSAFTWVPSFRPVDDGGTLGVSAVF